MLLERILPTPAVRPTWSSATFLFYTGALVVLVSGVALIGVRAAASAGNGVAVAAGWSALLFVLAALAAVALARFGQELLAGLGAFLAVVFLGVLTGSLAALARLGPDRSSGLLSRSFEPGLYLTELAVVAGGLAAIAYFRFPLIVWPVAGTLLFAVVDIGAALIGVPTLFSALGGAVLAAAGVVADRSGRRSYGFWLHVVGGLAIGEALFYFRQHGELGWTLIALGALAYVLAARVLGRPSYAVLGAIGILVVTSHWLGKWIGLVAPLPLIGPSGIDQRPQPWQMALGYLAVGLVLMLLGVLVLRGQEADDVDGVGLEPGGDLVA
jgi:hypothetical protein